MDEEASSVVRSSLKVDREALITALKQLKDMTGLCEEFAVLHYGDGYLRIRIAACSFGAAAEGTWQGQVKVPVVFLTGLAKLPKFCGANVLEPLGFSGEKPLGVDGNDIRECWMTDFDEKSCRRPIRTRRQPKRECSSAWPSATP